MLKKQNGITLISITVTIIVLLILVGIAILISNSILINKAIEASNKNEEATLKEQIEFAYKSCEMAYNENSKNLNKEEYIKQELPNYLNDLENIENLNCGEDVSFITFKFKNVFYKYSNSSLEMLLKGNVKVGDYVEYPCEYSDIYSKQKFYANTGWRVLDDGYMKNTSGYVKLISTAIPAKWRYINENENELSDLTLNNSLIMLNNQNRLRKNQSGKCFYSDFATKVTVLSLEELNNSYNEIYKSNRSDNDTTNILLDEEMFCLNAISEDPSREYWLFTINNENGNLYYIVPTLENQINSNEVDYQKGIRPVIWLKENLTVEKKDNVWKLLSNK